MRELSPPLGRSDDRNLDERLRDYAIAQIRAHRVMAQKEFAALAGRPEDWASKYLDREAPAGGLETSVRIAMALNVNLQQLTGLQDYPPSKPPLKFIKQLHRVWSLIPDKRKPRGLMLLQSLVKNLTLPPEEE